MSYMTLTHDVARVVPETARAGNRRVWPLSPLQLQAKPPQKDDLRWRTLRARKRRGQARTGARGQRRAERVPLTALGLRLAGGPLPPGAAGPARRRLGGLPGALRVLQADGRVLARRHVDVTTRTSHCESFTMSGTGYDGRSDSRVVSFHAAWARLRMKEGAAAGGRGERGACLCPCAMCACACYILCVCGALCACCVCAAWTWPMDSSSFCQSSSIMSSFSASSSLSSATAPHSGSTCAPGPRP